jgi:hypothetical protein
MFNKTRPGRRRLNRGAGVTIVLLAAVLCGCSSSKTSVSDPLNDLRNPRKSQAQRVEAVEAAWGAYPPGTPGRKAARESMKSLLWSQQTAEPVRVKIVQTLLADSDPAGLEDTHEAFKLLLPPERSRAVVAELCKGVAANGWVDVTPSLIRAYAVEVPRVREEQRPERVALEELHPGQAVEKVVFDAFLEPPAQGTIYGMDFQDRLRADAWNLLARLDSTGELRIELMGTLANSQASSDPMLADLQAGLRDLRVIPITGDELKWLRNMRDGKKGRHAERWREATTVIAGLSRETTGAISLRHVAPIVWASSKHPEWLSKGKDELYSMAAERLTGRSVNKRSDSDSGSIKQVSEQIGNSRDLLRWGDLLSILVILEALDDPSVRTGIFRQAALDRDDDSTEYGGLLRASAAEEPEGFVAVLYPPRPGQRAGDRQFIASDDLIASSDWALSHYHFHAQNLNNRQYAGPSSADIEYARRMRRSCLVFTSLGKGVMGVDYYQAAGAVVDLGEVMEQGR